MGIQRFEKRLEKMVEGMFAKAFRSGIQPVELGRRLTREMDLRRSVGVRGLVVPNNFTILLNPKDYERFESFADALCRELADAAREHARSSNYMFMGPVEVAIEPHPRTSAGVFMVSGEVVEGPMGASVGTLVLTDGTRVSVGEEPLKIGRSPECDVVLSDPNTSRRHAEVKRKGTDIVITDLGSTNGTKVNGAGITERKLVDGDEISAGATKIRFESS